MWTFDYYFPLPVRTVYSGVFTGLLRRAFMKNSKKNINFQIDIMFVGQM